MANSTETNSTILEPLANRIPAGAAKTNQMNFW